MNIEGRTIWITGASSGIGKAFAELALENGANLILSSRDSAKLKEIADGLNERAEKLFENRKPDVFILPLDLQDHNSLQKKVEEAWGVSGGVDILLNNGGVSQRSLLKDTKPDVIKTIIDTNFTGTAILTSFVSSKMVNGGYILAVSSVAGKFSTPLRTIYSASKMALQGLLDGLRAEMYKNNISVSLVVPGFVKTDISKNALKGDGKKYDITDPNQADGISPEKAASDILKGIKKEKREIYTGIAFKAKAGLFLSRFFPGLFSKIIRNTEVK